MDKKERIALIRKGNEFFNNGNIQKAIEIFVKTNYKDGLTRIADFYYYDKKMPLIAFKFYKMANIRDKVDEIFERMILALGEWIGEDKLKDDAIHQKKDYTPVKVSPKLKILAEEILMDNKDGNG
ncbi:MAG: hypothetical protein SVR08_02355 [Spirochaetota bacterium]|nr:hypothetical protein [Spirochaetota bacterium]